MSMSDRHNTVAAINLEIVCLFVCSFENVLFRALRIDSFTRWVIFNNSVGRSFCGLSSEEQEIEINL